MVSSLQRIERKVQNRDQIKKTIDAWRNRQHKIVFTNGCFDILHYGHVHYLAQARDLGDRLVVGLNSEASVRRLKGTHRPIHDEQTRQMILASLEYVDAVVVFEEDTPLNLIEVVQPDVLVKGGDWHPRDIVGSATVMDRGGKVLSLPYVSGYSTTAIEKKIKET